MTTERKLLAVVLVVVLMILSGCASMAPAAGDLRTFTVADVQRAYEIALAANDADGAGCAGAILAALPAEGVTALSPTGALSTFMLAREARRRGASLVPDTVHRACAVVVLEAEQTLAKLGLLAVPGGSALGGLIPK